MTYSSNRRLVVALRATSEWCHTVGSTPGTRQSSPFFPCGWKSPVPVYTREHPSVTRHTCSAQAVLQGIMFRATQTSYKFQPGQAPLSLKLNRCTALKSQRWSTQTIVRPDCTLSSLARSKSRRDALQNWNETKLEIKKGAPQRGSTAGRDQPVHRRRRQGA